MMSNDNGLLIVLGVLVLVILFNVGLILSFLRTGGRGQAALFRHAMRRALNPWREEEEALAELRERVAKLDQEENLQEPVDDNG